MQISSQLVVYLGSFSVIKLQNPEWTYIPTTTSTEINEWMLKIARVLFLEWGGHERKNYVSPIIFCHNQTKSKRRYVD